MTNVEVTIGDITQSEEDAIVNAANPMMLGGGGVDGAIHKAAGSELLEECKKIKAVDDVRCPFGEARITLSGELKSKYVIHAVGPIYSNEKHPAAVLTSAYKNSLALALSNNCQSIAFSAISCGVYGYPHQEAANIALSVCSLKDYRSLKIVFYIFAEELFEIFKAQLELTMDTNKF